MDERNVVAELKVVTLVNSYLQT